MARAPHFTNPRGPYDRAYREIERTWTWSYNRNLIGKDRLPTGKQVYDLPQVFPLPRTGARGYWSADNYSWTWKYNQNLIGKDVITTRGKQLTDLAPATPTWRQDRLMPELRSWTWRYNLNLIGKDRLPTGVINDGMISDLWRGRPDPVIWYRTWELNLQTTTLAIQLPPGEAFYDLSPRGYPRVEQSWYWNYNPNLIGQDQMVTGEQSTVLPPRGYQPLLQTWYWNYNLNLIGQDRMVTGEQFTDRPPPVNWYRSWELNLQTNTLGITIIPGIQFGQAYLTDLTPRGYPRVEQSWYWNYNPNLVGQDKLPTGEIVYVLPPIAVEPNPRRSWAWSYNLNLIGQDQLPTGAKITDLAYPRGVPRVEQSWYWSYNINLIGKDRLPTGKNIYDLAPIGYEPSPRRSWTWYYNINLIGKDQLPTGEQTTALTPGQLPPVMLNQRSWTWQYNLNLRGQDVIYASPGQVPTYDWQLARGPQPLLQTWLLSIPFPIFISLQSLPPGIMPGNLTYNLPPAQLPPLQLNQRSWYWNYNLNLIGKDRLPTGKNYYDLAPGQLPPVMFNQRSWVWRYNLNLIGKDRLPAGKDYYELPPAYYLPPLQLNQRSWTFRHNFELVGEVGLLPRNRESYELPMSWQVLTRRPIQTFYIYPFIPFIPPPAPTPVVMDANDLALIHNQQFVFYTPDDIFTVNTRHIYLNMETPIDPFEPLIVVFYRPNGSFFTMTFPFVAIGAVDLLTPKGLFLAGRYFVYTVAYDHFSYPGVWKMSHLNDGVGANFYVKQKNVRQLH